jgi:molybdopterin-guanine dinucleotide biosynthesis protein A
MRIYSLVLLLFVCSSSIAQQNKEAFTVENYYKVKWGFAEEFIGLWKANHYPLLKKAIEKGDILSVIAEKPKLHSGEDTRWDFKVTIVFKNAELAFDHELTEPYKKQLYPNLEKLAKDEKYRFELLLAHWDVMTEKIELNK